MAVAYRGWLWTVGVVLTVLATVICVSSMVFLYKYHNKRIVAMGQPRMLGILCLGCLMVTGGLATNTITVAVRSEHTKAMDVVCNFSFWLWYLGVTTYITILIGKLYRVYKVTQFRRNKPILPKHVFGPFAVAILVGIGIMIAAQIIAPSVYTIDQVDGFSYSYCQTRSYDSSDDSNQTSLNILTPIVEGYLDILVFGIMCFACKVRHVNEEIGNSRRIFWYFVVDSIRGTVVAILYSVVVVVPANGLTDTEKALGVFVTYLISLFLHAVLPIAFLVWPIMYYVWYEGKHGQLPEGVQMVGVGRVHVNVGPSQGANTASTTANITTVDVATGNGVSVSGDTGNKAVQQNDVA